MPSATSPSNPNRAEVLSELRRMLSRMEGVAQQEEARLSFGLPALDTYLPQNGLAFGAVHEITAASEADLPAAFGFFVSLLARTPGHGPLLLVLSSRKLARCGTPHGDGLADLGLDPSRLTLVETANEAEALWATEEAVRARGPAAVAGVLGGKLTLKDSQRLSHAAREANLPLLLLRAGEAADVATAATRWRIGAAPAARDRFGLLSGWRWHATLERCRNGRPGNWMLEFDHATHRFGLAAAMADPSLACGGAT
ncbi:ImuA protein [Hyphomicrobium sp. LHD-15]|uniref:ImuA family protein n=1 Tax=Hyphomicrobium sp. LHD-15 TaxID=3072142 RepID=UPI00280E6FA2|nr:ImuA protein [Hyphomicrobium sp. LHD-15]MDQ8699607.1 ImuA protein [Hyphomicrobium sp. LHD-15]